MLSNKKKKYYPNNNWVVFYSIRLRHVQTSVFLVWAGLSTLIDYYVHQTGIGRFVIDVGQLPGFKQQWSAAGPVLTPPWASYLMIGKV